jgi:hypothetical protein
MYVVIFSTTLSKTFLVLRKIQQDIIVFVQICTAPDGHLLRVTIPDAVLIQFDLLRMSKILLETCTCRGL